MVEKLLVSQETFILHVNDSFSDSVENCGFPCLESDCPFLDFEWTLHPI